MDASATVTQFLDALTADDPSLLWNILAPDFLFQEVAGPGEPSRQALRHELQVLHAAFPDIAYRPVRQTEAEGRTILEFRAFGTHRGDFLGVRPTGTLAILSGVFNLEIGDGRVRRLRLTIDFGGLRRQLLMAARQP